MRSIIWISVICLVVGVGVYTYNQTSQQDIVYVSQEEESALQRATLEKMKQVKIAAAARVAAEQAQAKARQAAEAVATAQKTAEKAAQAADIAVEEAQAQVEGVGEQTQEEVADLAVEIQELIAQAQAYLAEGSYQQAITIAQNILSNYDAESTEAKSILDIAKEKLAAAANEKVDEFTTTITDQADGLKSKIGSLGQ